MHSSQRRLLASSVSHSGASAVAPAPLFSFTMATWNMLFQGYYEKYAGNNVRVTPPPSARLGRNPAAMGFFPERRHLIRYWCLGALKHVDVCCLQECWLGTLSRQGVEESPSGGVIQPLDWSQSVDPLYERFIQNNRRQSSRGAHEGEQFSLSRSLPYLRRRSSPASPITHTLVCGGPSLTETSCVIFKNSAFELADDNVSSITTTMFTVGQQRMKKRALLVPLRHIQSGVHVNVVSCHVPWHGNDSRLRRQVLQDLSAACQRGAAAASGSSGRDHTASRTQRIAHEHSHDGRKQNAPSHDHTQSPKQLVTVIGGDFNVAEKKIYGAFDAKQTSSNPSSSTRPQRRGALRIFNDEEGSRPLHHKAAATTEESRNVLASRPLPATVVPSPTSSLGPLNDFFSSNRGWVDASTGVPSTALTANGEYQKIDYMIGRMDSGHSASPPSSSSAASAPLKRLKLEPSMPSPDFSSRLPYSYGEEGSRRDMAPRRSDHEGTPPTEANQPVCIAGNGSHCLYFPASDDDLIKHNLPSADANRCVAEGKVRGGSDGGVSFYRDFPSDHRLLVTQWNLYET